MNRTLSLGTIFMMWNLVIGSSFLYGFDTPHNSEYKGPMELLASKDKTRLFVLHHDSNDVTVLSFADHKIIQTIPVASQPRGFVFNPDESILYVVSGGYDGKLQAVNIKSEKIIKEITVGHTPVSPVVSPDGKKLFLCNRFDNDISEYDLPDLKLVRRIKVVREPKGAVITPDGKSLYVINGLPNDPNNHPEDENKPINVAAEVTVIETVSGQTKNIRLPDGSGSVLDICISSDGRYVYLTHILSRYKIPTTQLERGWMNTNAVSVVDTTRFNDPNGGFVNTILIDDVDRGAANPWGIDTSPDGNKLYVAVSGTNELMVIDAGAMHKKLADYASKGKSGEVSYDLLFLSGMKERINLEGIGPRAVLAHQNSVYVGMYFSDTLQKIDLTKPGTLGKMVIPLGPSPKLTSIRRGEMYWHDATLCYQAWQSCASCHPDVRVDALNWDLLNDGMGNPKNTKSLLLCHECAPAMWEGVRASSEVCTRTGFKHILFTEPDEAKCLDIDAYIGSLKPETSPYLVNGQLSEKAKRGKRIFEDAKVGCVICHPKPYHTDQKLHDVKSKCFYDRNQFFDTPALVESWRTAPYLHDGRYIEMRDLFIKEKHGDTHGDVKGLTEKEIDDLVEYVLSL